MIHVGWAVGGVMGIGALCLAVMMLAQNAWVNVVALSVLLVVFLATMCLGENGIIGIGERDQDDRVLYRWRKAHPRLFDGLLYGLTNCVFIGGISFNIMSRWTGWTSAVVYRHQANAGWLCGLAIWSGVTFVVVFVSSAFVRDRAVVGWVTACFSTLLAIMVLQPLTLLQALCVASSTVACSFVASRMCFLDASERIRTLFRETRE